MPKTKRTSSNSNSPKTKRASSNSTRSANQQNGLLNVAALRSLKQEYLAAETKEARAKMLKPLPREQRWELTFKWYRSLRTDKAREHFLSLLSSSDLHALFVTTIQENHRNGRRPN